MVRVWIDQDLCTGDGICVEICPSVFDMHDDGLAYVKEPDWPNLYGPNGEIRSGGDPVLKMSEGMATVPDEDIDALIDAAEECPGECIFIEAD
jgi:ferredoxin